MMSVDSGSDRGAVFGVLFITALPFILFLVIWALS